MPKHYRREQRQSKGPKRLADSKQEPRLTEKTMVALGFVRVGRRRGGGGYWARSCGGNNLMFTTLPTASKLIYEIGALAAYAARGKWRAAIKDALELYEPALS